ncbi:MAG TPA: Ig-like domain-containing protein [Candidatus Dormibacteraeota bacterium]|nr:Ig-like domain-containing protein [Candidatus Dormibacteraeota bacterium]
MGRRRALMLAALMALSMPAALHVSAARQVAVVRGAHYGSRIFPDNAFSIADGSQATGRRVNFRVGIDYPTVNGVVQPGCTSADYSICDGFAALNKLDGFDLQPRVTVPFTGAVNLASVSDRDVFISDHAGAFVSGLRQLTFDPATNTLAGISDHFLREGTSYRIHVTGGIRDSAGNAVNTCNGACVVQFTTRSATGELVRIRQSMDLPLADPSNAYVLAGFPGATTSTDGRRLTFTQGGTNDVFLAASVAPSVADPLNGIERTDQLKVDPAAPGAFQSSAVPNLIPPGSAGYYAFGSFLSPRYQYASATGHQDNPYGTGDGRTDGEIPPVPTTQTPRPFAADRLGAIVVTPNPALFPPPWPAAVYGPGFTRSKYDLFVTADYNAAEGIVTVATDPSGHGFGPLSTTTVTSNNQPTTFLSYGRGRDLDGDGLIGSGLNDGVGPTGHFQPGGTELPSRKPLDGLESGLVQTTVDDMALGRALTAGLDIPGVGTNLVNTSRIMYYGLSFGGIYGTMLMGTDPLFHQGLLNVAGGPIADIARLSSFRGDLAAQLGRSRPSYLNGGPGNNGFTEDLPLRNDPSEIITHGGAAALQELFANTNWYDRTGSPETFAPRIRLRPDAAWAANPKNVVFQTAYGDGTTTDPTAATLYRAGQLFDRVVFYRNDKTPTYASDPHGWLADPTLAGRTSGEQQLGAFLLTGQLVNTNPAWLEVPIADPNNLECLHYPDPQTGQPQTRQPYPASGDCPPPPAPG